MAVEDTVAITIIIGVNKASIAIPLRLIFHYELPLTGKRTSTSWGTIPATMILGLAVNRLADTRMAGHPMRLGGGKPGLAASMRDMILDIAFRRQDLVRSGKGLMGMAAMTLAVMIGGLAERMVVDVLMIIPTKEIHLLLKTATAEERIRVMLITVIGIAIRTFCPPMNLDPTVIVTVVVMNHLPWTVTIIGRADILAQTTMEGMVDSAEADTEATSAPSLTQIAIEVMVISMHAQTEAITVTIRMKTNTRIIAITTSATQDRRHLVGLVVGRMMAFQEQRRLRMLETDGLTTKSSGYLQMWTKRRKSSEYFLM